ncbi:hypothetical protein [Plantactinospora sp. KLBMP9567]|uniref:hypothetical protein n=1 Tax=Plantactinospora sp. KLBMP9567 TaxID=3085900 RepID=UPI0029817A78|nr:hypothetical protein [Plantactinospora sp. KLBMP9567]MDW5326176.1 hypothetical protein [Plantactinospora sp. KLBMP9567]
MDALTDFLLQMEIATLEETPLYAIPRGSVDLVTPPVTHGPWPAATCAAVLRIWHKADWIGLYLPDYPAEWRLVPADWCTRLVDGDTLAEPDAEELLDHPERWLLQHADGHVAPYKTAAGETTPWEQWHKEALDMAKPLPLKTHNSKC